jgi:DNA replication protein DnaC
VRSQIDVDEFAQNSRHRIVHGCKLCQGTDISCACWRKQDFIVKAYEACIPKDFWFTKKEDIDHNVEVFKDVILKYIGHLTKALNKGYGLALLGDNGVGKTYFLSYILAQAIRKGRTVYYTTMPQLDYDIKRGFDDKKIAARLDFMLTSDFIAIDELGKEKYKAGTTFTDTQFERILKRRCDDGNPVLIATNMDFQEVIEQYGPTVGSIIEGKLQPVQIPPGDYRKRLAKKMAKDMDY